MICLIPTPIIDSRRYNYAVPHPTEIISSRMEYRAILAISPASESDGKHKVNEAKFTLYTF